ncbi:Lamin Tail Domain [Bryocella elongata]|uniref:Lamin Tail Domain n=1 Tax=Bryocella elongata TaxID=863522 RepID=A0A1H5UQP1_9BACT|nr:arabinofuranosidase catalytic domain-containing protein [Bryocella elongata]SEF77402.1 Lamin Tail Domain [Bryocella elongata]
MTTRTQIALKLALPLALLAATLTSLAQTGTAHSVPPGRPQGPCDIYAAAADPCVAAYSTTRALFASYNGPLYQILRQSDGKTLDIGVVEPVAAPWPDAGGYANAPAQDAFCANTYCWITTLFDQSPKHNDLVQAPRGHFSGPAMGGNNNLPIADAAPITVMGHKAYGVFITPGMGLRLNDAKGTAVDDQAEGQYWVINGRHFNSGCCFDFGNAEIDSADDGNGTMETTYFGDGTGWYHGPPPGPWVMTDQENNLVGCANPDGSKLCGELPNIPWRFVTAMAKGEPHHWTSLGGDAQKGGLSVMFDGPRINPSYDPMRKQGAILLGNGGDNSNGSQGTFYEGAMTAAGTFPADATDRLVQANVVAAKYDVQQLSLTPSSSTSNAPGLQTFSPGSAQDTTITFTNTSDTPAIDVRLSISVPDERWTSVVPETHSTSATPRGPVAPGASISATFKITSGTKAFNGDLVGRAQWKASTSRGRKLETSTFEKVRNVSPIKINEFRVGTGSPINPTNSFIELYNAGASQVDLSNWTLTEHAAQRAIFSTVMIPSGRKLAPHSFYLLGLSNSGLAVPAHNGDTSIYVRSTAGMQVGDTIGIDTGSSVETRRIVSLGKAAGAATTLWQPMPDGPIISVPAGSNNVPVANVTGFVVGEKIALGYGASFPYAANTIEHDEIATVTAIGKPGTAEAYIATDAPAGSTNIKVTSVAKLSVGDKIRLDIDSMGHGIESVTVAHIGTEATRTVLAATAGAGATNIKVRSVKGFAVGDKIVLGTPANLATATIATVGAPGPSGTGIDFTPALANAHVKDEDIISPGTGIDLAAPLKFNHAANLPFNDRGTGISFEPVTAFAHLSGEPVQPLGTGIMLDGPLTKDHAIDAVVLDAAVTTAGYQGTPAPDQRFGGPALSTTAGTMVLRDADGLVVDSLNYGLVVDPWAAEGYQANSGARRNGCRVNAPSAAGSGIGVSAGRFPDGADTDSNCTDFIVEPATSLAVAADAGAKTIKVLSVAGFAAGQVISIDTNAHLETIVIAAIGTAGSAGSGITLGAALKQAHAPAAQVSGNSSTPGARNHYDRGQR